MRSADTARSKERSFAARCREFDSVAEAFARNPGPATLDQAQAAWSNAMLAWRPAQVVRSGPLLDQDILSRIHFWPNQRLIDPSVDLAAPVPPTWILALRN